jgi:hypothetical protein
MKRGALEEINMRIKLVLAAAALSLTPAFAFAQAGAGAVAGAAAGAVVGGPVGAVVGAGIGAAAGATLDPRLRTYVIERHEPSIAITGDVVVGERLPPDVVLYPVPDYDDYSYAIVNNRHIVVDARTGTVVDIID